MAATDPAWLIELRTKMYAVVREAMLGRPSHHPGFVDDVADAATELAVSHLRPLHDQLAERTSVNLPNLDSLDLSSPERGALFDRMRAALHERQDFTAEATVRAITAVAIDFATPTIEIPDHPTGGHGLAGDRRQVVAAKDVHPGDKVTLVGVVREGREGAGQLYADGVYIDLDFEVLVISREMPALPTTPGSVGTATVKGRTGVRVMRATDFGGALGWAVASVDTGSPSSLPLWVNDDDIADYVSELEGRGE